MKRDYRWMWPLPPPMPRRWPLIDLALFTLVLAIAAVTLLWAA
jgi:hypothetical protein